jgi:pyruvate kinase
LYVSDIVDDVEPGDRILINDGLIELQALSKNDRFLECKVMVGGPLMPHKGINLPGVKVSSPALTEKDRKDLEWGIEHGVDYMALSFVRRADDVRELKDILRSRGADIQVVAKIEKPEAMKSSRLRMQSWWRGEILAWKCTSKKFLPYKNTSSRSAARRIRPLSSPRRCSNP